MVHWELTASATLLGSSVTAVYILQVELCP